MPVTLHNRDDFLRLIVPALTSIALFCFAAYGIFLPGLRQAMMTEKKTMIQEMTNVAWHFLQRAYREEQSGKHSRRQAQQIALTDLEQIRYGRDNKEYFWINDFSPTLLMHPYRPDLVGADLADYADPEGTKLFKEFIRVARERGQGFVSYMWQWKDDPEKIVPKLSFVKEFKPWGWIVGTGIYLDDVEAEIARTSRKLTVSVTAITALVVLLSLLLTRQALTASRREAQAKAELIAYKDQLEEMVRDRTRELEDSLAQVKQLSGLLPICAHCKKIRDDSGYWNRIDSYIQQHSEAIFSHSICPDCMHIYYPDLADEVLNEDADN